ncbi:MAG: dTDP-glucose 4,6-dehydratase [Deltaproteobacteria bacterium]|jgi:dTDP-glucose 4,6-dehydratase|nr:dTDP-glucose 4,6-dehydratase [Deltaproteobacteria bacterium]
MTILVTGGCGFIGTNFILDWVREVGERVVNLDRLTYAGNRDNLSGLPEESYLLVEGDVCDGPLVSRLLSEHSPRAVVHLAAESHVDRSITGPAEFIRTNVLGTFTMLEAARDFHQGLTEARKGAFRFLHVSTDEVYGSLGPSEPPFTEGSPKEPNSPYSASKAAGDHLARAWHKTYGLPVVVTNCSNNYGPYQFPEKLIPLMIQNALEEKPLPVYGDGLQVRDWLHVSDHARALRVALEKGIPGETYNIGGNSERNNMQVVGRCCSILDRLIPPKGVKERVSLISHVTDRPGHDRRYAIDAGKIKALGFTPSLGFEEGLLRTIEWYLDNQKWVKDVLSGDYMQWKREGGTV